ncbi:MAG: YifB family Mg chelatase-like AAA ATPase [Lachnospiraceae bacterium]|nr:YifB family Mg chelatase-like AAA ATPase [Lachnospiraceae bacterium]
MFSRILSGACLGISCYLMQIEVDISSGLPAMIMVGSPGNTIREGADRIRAALRNCGFYLPACRITVNFTPADVPKRDMIADLPVAAGILICMDVLPPDSFQDCIILGELSLDGDIRPVKGVLPIVEEAKKQGVRTVILPAENSAEASIVEGMRIIGVRTLRQLIDWTIAAPQYKDRIIPPAVPEPSMLFSSEQDAPEFDFSSVYGQHSIKHVLEIAASGGHNVLMIGPPGSGKSMLAKCVPGILPPLTREESLELTRIYSIAGKLDSEHPLLQKRPFLSPHHSVSRAALIGGGMVPSPGQITLAHRGILFLDELPEFPTELLNMLREPLEEKKVTITRAGASAVFPANNILIAAANPCPCGYYPDMNRCTCTQPQIEHYRNKIPGPILDRIDLYADVSPVKIKDLLEYPEEESSEVIRSRVIKVRQKQQERFDGTGISCNADMGTDEIAKFCILGTKEKEFVSRLFNKLGLTARSYHKLLKTARTIADMQDSDRILTEHIAEAAAYRRRN